MYSFQQTTKVSCYKCLEEKTKVCNTYYILLREKQKYHISSCTCMFFQTLLKTLLFLAAFVILSGKICLQGNLVDESFYLMVIKGK